jgi:hypothetical protein
VYLFLQSIVRHANGMLSVTPACSSLEEMEREIEQLKEELDEMLRQTRHAFRVSAGHPPAPSPAGASDYT